jgi:hypothetical protein
MRVCVTTPEFLGAQQPTNQTAKSVPLGQYLRAIGLSFTRYEIARYGSNIIEVTALEPAVPTDKQPVLAK